MTRDARTDPQPGDEVRVSSGELLRALKCEGDKVLVESSAIRTGRDVGLW